jgi:hypothetical protein
MLSTIIEEKALYDVIDFVISGILISHRKTEYFQLEIEPFSDFEKSVILRSIAETDRQREYLENQINSLPTESANWNPSLIKNKVKFISQKDLQSRKLKHFRFSVPLLSEDGQLLILKQVFQPNFLPDQLLGSSCIELYKGLNDDWKYAGHLFGTSI